MIDIRRILLFQILVILCLSRDFILSSVGARRSKGGHIIIIGNSGEDKVEKKVIPVPVPVHIPCPQPHPQVVYVKVPMHHHVHKPHMAHSFMHASMSQISPMHHQIHHHQIHHHPVHHQGSMSSMSIRHVMPPVIAPVIMQKIPVFQKEPDPVILQAQVPVFQKEEHVPVFQKEENYASNSGASSSSSSSPSGDLMGSAGTNKVRQHSFHHQDDHQSTQNHHDLHQDHHHIPSDSMGGKDWNSMGFGGDGGSIGSYGHQESTKEQPKGRFSKITGLFKLDRFKMDRARHAKLVKQAAAQLGKELPFLQHKLNSFSSTLYKS